MHNETIISHNLFKILLSWQDSQAIYISTDCVLHMNVIFHCLMIPTEDSQTFSYLATLICPKGMIIHRESEIEQIRILLLISKVL